MSLQEQIRQLAKEIHPQVIELRRKIHANPELAFEEKETAALVAEKLGEFDIPYETGIAKTGVVGLLEGQKGNGKVIALRADMDALPIYEANDVPYKSAKEGSMHACGHDVHTASLLGTAKILAALRHELKGKVKFIFQPSEEKAPGGASVMIKENVLKDPESGSIVGQHVYPELQAGKVGFRSGMYMASADEIYLKVKGKGGHGALPHNNIDPVLIASHIIVALQQVTSRNAPSIIPSVLSFGKISGEGATNVIPDEVNIEGTFRTMDEAWRKEAHNRIRQIAAGVAESMGGACEVRVETGYPCLINDEKITPLYKKYAEEYLGADNVIDLDLRMTAEDFAFYTHQIPGCFYRLGVGNESKGITSSVHTPTFDIDESALEVSTGLMAWIAVKALE